MMVSSPFRATMIHTFTSTPHSTPLIKHNQSIHSRMKLSIFASIVGLVGIVAAQTGCENQADPDHGIGNYCYCSSTGGCYAHSVVNGNEVCNPPGASIPCPD
ncbi:hypothetical protein BKA67DRAFT_584803 [Truncatella angustata]|uniref:Uncharacterized protein n=1 Tax=Truncatella angustata TaxID=152316 RepID=A0A9P8RJP4_9PEZI|nr:uncharacterized protein BKA67DRAFT_584803 [Truncatella angustata]KAH6645331.1 hypothetical protein BKA67DRAFT_584803 [Truncatella angustata]